MCKKPCTFSTHNSELLNATANKMGIEIEKKKRNVIIAPLRKTYAHIHAYAQFKVNNKYRRRSISAMIYRSVWSAQVEKHKPTKNAFFLSRIK